MNLGNTVSLMAALIIVLLLWLRCSMILIASFTLTNALPRVLPLVILIIREKTIVIYNALHTTYLTSYITFVNLALSISKNCNGNHYNHNVNNPRNRSSEFRNDLPSFISFLRFNIQSTVYPSPPTKGSRILRSAPVGAKPRSTGPRAPLYQNPATPCFIH